MRSIRGLVVIAIILILAGASLLAWPALRRMYEYRAEDALLRDHPSGETAFKLGNLHFSARNAREYDVERAKHLFHKTLELDPDHPTAYAQLARTYFVAHDSTTALALVSMQIAKHPDATPSAYYIRALALGYLKRYDESAQAYARYIELNPTLWAAYNDLAWTKIQSGDDEGAVEAADKGLAISAVNPWLLTMKATALYQLGRYEEALQSAQKAVPAADAVTQAQWIEMYPGNDPATIEPGIATLQRAARNNLAKIQAAAASSTPRQ